MKYPGWQTDKDMYGQTPIVRWFAYRLAICLDYDEVPEPVPEDMFYDGWEDAKDMD